MSRRRPAASPPAREPDRQIPGVEYAELGGLLTFQCKPYRCKLRPSACAARFRRAAALHKRYLRHAAEMPPDEFEARAKSSRCVGCPIGAGHAGVDQGRGSRLIGTMICCRTGEGVTRMIGGRLSVSAANRQYEWVKGRNAKGTWPAQATPLTRQVVRYRVDNGPAQVLEIEYARDKLELMMHLLRITPGTVQFLASPLAPLTYVHAAPVPSEIARLKAAAGATA
jgi:hypothetical protein